MLSFINHYFIYAKKNHIAMTCNPTAHPSFSLPQGSVLSHSSTSVHLEHTSPLEQVPLCSFLSFHFFHKFKTLCFNEVTHKFKILCFNETILGPFSSPGAFPELLQPPLPLLLLALCAFPFQMNC